MKLQPLNLSQLWSDFTAFVMLDPSIFVFRLSRKAPFLRRGLLLLAKSRSDAHNSQCMALMDATEYERTRLINWDACLAAMRWDHMNPEEKDEDVAFFG